MNPILECQGLSKQYKNFYALNNLNSSDQWNGTMH